jgi:hypothetical protein
MLRDSRNTSEHPSAIETAGGVWGAFYNSDQAAATPQNTPQIRRIRGRKEQEIRVSESRFPAGHLAQPLRVLIGAVKMMAGFVQLELSGLCGFGRLREHCSNILLAQRPEISCRF